MTGWNIFALTAGAIMLAAAVAVAIYRVMRTRAGEATEKKRIGKLLRNYAAPRGFQVLHNVTLVCEGLSGWADHIVIGHFGVLLVYDLCWNGSYYGKEDEDKWTLSVPDKGRFRIENPLRAGVKCAGRINILLKQNNIKLSVDSVAVITHREKATINYIKGQNVVTYKEFKKYLKKAKFDQDKDVDVEKITALLSQAQG